MMRKSHIFLSLFLILLLASCSKAEQDVQLTEKNKQFDIFCDQFSKLTQAADYSELSSEDRAERLENMLAAHMQKTSDAYIAWTAIRNGPPAERYFLFDEAANSIGYQTWDCPAIKQHGHEVGSVFK